MRKILLHSGMSPFDNPTLGEIIINKYSIGSNLGNLMYSNSVARTILTEDSEIVSTYYQYDYTDEEVENINSSYDCFAIPLADAFRKDFIPQLNKLTSLVNRLTIPCVVIGVGLRADYDQKSLTYSFDNDVKEFVKAVLNKSTKIGLRGVFTGQYLNHLGFKEEVDYTVIGCPSLYFNDGKISIKQINKTELSCSFNATLLGKEIVKDFFLRSINEVPDASIILQLDTEFRHYYLGKYMTIRKDIKKIPETLYGEEIYNNLYSKNKVMSFSNIHSWIRYLETRDISINTRFHGSVVSILAGIPTVVIPIDSRMRELANYHGLTVIDPGGLAEHCDLDYWMEKLDFHSCEKKASQNFHHYLQFLADNDIENIYTNGIRTQESKYDKLIESISWKCEKAFNQVSSIEKLHRIITVYGPSIRSAIKRP